MIINSINLIMLLLVLFPVIILITDCLLSITILMSMFSLTISLFYLKMNAPDVAITEAAVGAGVSTLFIFAALALLKTRKSKYNSKSIILFLGIISSTIAIVYALMNEFLPLGNPLNPIHQPVSQFYITKTDELTGIPNIVTAILASFRGYDTLIETSVVFAAGIAIYSLLMEGKNE